jgi:hypothetical protein
VRRAMWRRWMGGRVNGRTDDYRPCSVSVRVCVCMRDTYFSCMSGCCGAGAFASLPVHRVVCVCVCVRVCVYVCIYICVCMCVCGGAFVCVSQNQKPSKQNKTKQNKTTQTKPSRTEGKRGGEGGGRMMGLRKALLETPDPLPARFCHLHARPQLLHHQEGEAHAHDLGVWWVCKEGGREGEDELND